MSSNNNLGTGVVGLSASADALSADLSKAQKDVEGWGARVGAGLKAGLGPVVGIGAAVGGSLVAGFEVATRRLDELGKISKRADVLGVSASDLQGMDELFKKVGVEAGQADAVFAKMGKSIRDIEETAKGFAKAQEQATGKGLDATSALESQFEAKAKIASLGRMGIKVGDLENKSLTEQFKIVADGINKLPRGFQQAAAAQDFFGRSGAQLLPMLQRGSKGVEEFIEHHKKLGGVLSDSQLKSARDASKAWKEAKNEVETAWEGFKNQLALIAAPAVKEIAEKGKELVHDWLIPAAKYSADFAKGFVDAGVALKNMKPGEGGAPGSEVFKGKHGESSFLDYFPKASEVGASITTMATGLNDAFKDAGKQIDDFNGRLFGPNAERFFSKENQKPADTTKRFLDELNKPPPPPPPPPTGVISGWLARVRQTEAAVRQFRELGAVGGELFKQTPLAGLLAQQVTTAEQAWVRIVGNLAKAPNPFRGGLADAPAKFAGAFEKGTREAYSLELKNQFRDMPAGSATPQEEANKKLGDVKTELGGIRRAVERLLGLAGEVEAV